MSYSDLSPVFLCHWHHHCFYHQSFPSNIATTSYLHHCHHAHHHNKTTIAAMHYSTSPFGQTIYHHHQLIIIVWPHYHTTMTKHTPMSLHNPVRQTWQNTNYSTTAFWPDNYKQITPGTLSKNVQLSAWFYLLRTRQWLTKYLFRKTRSKTN